MSHSIIGKSQKPILVAERGSTSRNKQKTDYLQKLQTTDNSGRVIDHARLEAEFKKDMCRGKSNFARSRNELLLLFESQDIPSRRGVRYACDKMDSFVEVAMDVLSIFSDLYGRNQDN